MDSLYSIKEKLTDAEYKRLSEQARDAYLQEAAKFYELTYLEPYVERRYEDSRGLAYYTDTRLHKTILKMDMPEDEYERIVAEILNHKVYGIEVTDLNKWSPNWREFLTPLKCYNIAHAGEEGSDEKPAKIWRAIEHHLKVVDLCIVN
jgi:hypothetical protein